jgi:hypothetical protein
MFSDKELLELALRVVARFAHSRIAKQAAVLPAVWESSSTENQEISKRVSSKAHPK